MPLPPQVLALDVFQVAIARMAQIVNLALKIRCFFEGLKLYLLIKDFSCRYVAPVVFSTNRAESKAIKMSSK